MYVFRSDFAVPERFTFLIYTSGVVVYFGRTNVLTSMFCQLASIDTLRTPYPHCRRYVFTRQAVLLRPVVLIIAEKRKGDELLLQGNYSAAIWIFFLMILGNLTTAIYVIYCINTSNKDIKKFFLGDNI